jgi:outer membrane protein OmpA-like peptidoglycan-associated protein
MKATLLMITGISLITACTTPGKRTAVGTGAGAATGAGAGAIIGHQMHNEAGGAAIGAAVGAVLGGTLGNRLDRQAKDLAQIAETQRTQEGIVTKLKNDVLFDYNSADLKAQAKSNVDQIGSILKQYPEDHIIVVGYTDNKGSQMYNQQLSERRARSVKLALVAAGVPAESIEVMGQGESNPIASNDTPAGQAKNRRVELQISGDPGKVRP